MLFYLYHLKKVYYVVCFEKDKKIFITLLEKINSFKLIFVRIKNCFLTQILLFTININFTFFPYSICLDFNNYNNKYMLK